MPITVTMSEQALTALHHFLEWRSDLGPEGEGWDSPEFAEAKAAIEGAYRDASGWTAAFPRGGEKQSSSASG